MLTKLQNPALLDLVNSGRAWRGHERACIEAEPTQHHVLDALLPGGGWPVGAFCEIVHAKDGLGELSLVLPLLAHLTRSGRPVALLAPPHLPYVPAFLSQEIELGQLLVVEAPEPDSFWAAEQLLHAHAAAVLLWARRAEPQVLRRLQLAAEDVRAFVFLFHDGRLRNFSPAALRLRVLLDRQVEILKCRGGAIGQRVAWG